MKVYLCDDNKTYLEWVKRKVEAILYYGRIEMDLGGAYTDPDVLLKTVSKNTESGLYILDIELGCSYNGIELAGYIRRYDPRGFIVFLTNHPELTERAMKSQVEAMDYIIKGEKEEERLRQCILTAMERYTSKSNRFEKLIRFHTDNGVLWQDIRSLVYIKTAERTRWLELHLENGDVKEASMTLKELMENLSDERFDYCYRGCIVNKSCIVRFDDKNNYLLLKNGEKLEVSVRCRKNFK